MLFLEHDKPHHIPWNKGKITGQKPPLKLNEVWAIRIRLQIADKNEISHSLIWRLIASYVAVIWLNLKSVMSHMVPASQSAVL